MENLDVKQMTRKDNVNLLTECNKQSIACKKVIGKNRSKSMKKSILHISFHMFKKIIGYKCAINRVYLSLVDPRNTSKTCSKCGNIDDQSSNRMQQALLVKKHHKKSISVSTLWSYFR